LTNLAIVCAVLLTLDVPLPVLADGDGLPAAVLEIPFCEGKDGLPGFFEDSFLAGRFVGK
jgi:hypothetical protein